MPLLFRRSVDSKSGELTGTVTALDIQDAIFRRVKSKNLDLKIDLESPLKRAGLHTLPISENMNVKVEIAAL